MMTIHSEGPSANCVTGGDVVKDCSVGTAVPSCVCLPVFSVITH